MYPNLGTHDAFLTVRKGDTHYVVRASKELHDRSDLSVGPMRVEVLEPLRRLRITVEPGERDLSCDLVWDAAMPAWDEPRHYVRKHGRTVFDTSRFAQTGRWTGWLEVDGERIEVTPDRWWGSRDRSWGVRPVGEPEAPGIQTETVMTGMWNYVPMQFDDHSILLIIQEEGDGTRTLEEAVRVWADPARGHDWLGRPEVEHTLVPGTRMVQTPVTFHLPDAPGGPLAITATSLTYCYLGIGTGYGLGDDFRHGMYLGPDMVTESKRWSMTELDTWAWYAIVEHAARFEVDGNVGYGMLEHFFIGAYPKNGLTDGSSVAP
jgi:hypothetical protein